MSAHSIITILDVQRAVAERFGMTMDEMTGARRNFRLSRPRQIAYFLARKLTRHSYPEIGRRFGGRDHTTVIHGERALNERMKAHPIIAAAVAEIEAGLIGRAYVRAWEKAVTAEWECPLCRESHAADIMVCPWVIQPNSEVRT